VIDQQRHPRIGSNILYPAQLTGSDGLGLGVDRLIDRFP
jgi:hypothetical protein